MQRAHSTPQGPHFGPRFRQRSCSVATNLLQQAPAQGASQYATIPMHILSVAAPYPTRLPAFLQLLQGPTHLSMRQASLYSVVEGGLLTSSEASKANTTV